MQHIFAVTPQCWQHYHTNPSTKPAFQLQIFIIQIQKILVVY